MEVAVEFRNELNNMRKQIFCLEAFIKEASKEELNGLARSGDLPCDFQKFMEYVEEYRRLDKETREIAKEALEARHRERELWQQAASGLNVKGDLLQHMISKGIHSAIHGRKKYDGEEYGAGGLEYHTM